MSDTTALLALASRLYAAWKSAPAGSDVFELMAREAIAALAPPASTTKFCAACGFDEDDHGTERLCPNMSGSRWTDRAAAAPAPAFEDDDPSSVPEGTGDTWSAPLRKPVGAAAPAPEGLADELQAWVTELAHRAPTDERRAMAATCQKAADALRARPAMSDETLREMASLAVKWWQSNRPEAKLFDEMRAVLARQQDGK